VDVHSADTFLSCPESNSIWLECVVLCISDSFFCSCSICFCSNSAALAGLCLKWPTTFSTFGQDIVKHTVVQTYCDRMLETVCDAGDVFKRQMFCSSNHIPCTVLSVLTLFETFHCSAT